MPRPNPRRVPTTDDLLRQFDEDRRRNDADTLHELLHPHEDEGGES